jgi:hypothetical protein
MQTFTTYCENHAEHVNTLYGKIHSSEMLYQLLRTLNAVLELAG